VSVDATRDASVTTLVSNIRLTGDPAKIECKAETVRGLVLRAAFLKKA